jgi:hypothetical protein
MEVRSVEKLLRRVLQVAHSSFEESGLKKPMVRGAARTGWDNHPAT